MTQQPNGEFPERPENHDDAAAQQVPEHPEPTRPISPGPTAHIPAPGTPVTYGPRPDGQPHQQPAPGYAQQEPNPWTQPQSPGGDAPPAQPERRGFGCGTLAAGVIIAGLVGGGAALGGYYLLQQQDDGSTVEVDSDGGIEINDPQDATAITAAADKAAPSVVTLAVGGNEGAGSGSGIILDDQGHVLTNTHVVTLGGAEAEPEIQARLSDGRVISAEVVGTDPLSDLAVIQLEETDDLVPAELGGSADLNVGDQTIAIGAPLSLDGTVTTGIVSTLDRTIQVASAAVDPEQPVDEDDLFEDVPDSESEEPEQPEEPGDPDDDGYGFFFPNTDPTAEPISLNVIQTDAAINQGNSGGALVDSQGRVIGVNVAIATAGGGMFGSEGAGSIGVGFAIPIDYASRVAEDLIENGEASHGLLGVNVFQAASDPEVNEHNLSAEPTDLQPVPGFSVGGLVVSVAEGSPAEEAGIQAGDIIEAVEGRRIEDANNLTAIIREYREGETISLTVVRDDERTEIDVTLTAM